MKRSNKRSQTTTSTEVKGLPLGPLINSFKSIGSVQLTRKTLPLKTNYETTQVFPRICHRQKVKNPLSDDCVINKHGKVEQKEYAEEHHKEEGEEEETVQLDRPLCSHRKHERRRKTEHPVSPPLSDIRWPARQSESFRPDQWLPVDKKSWGA
eukprot:751335-Hanusia_phi.AAC.4